MADDYLKKFAPVATHLSSPTSTTKSANSGHRLRLLDRLIGGDKKILRLAGRFIKECA